MQHPKGRPWIIAHRGASQQARQNTIEAFELAATLGADAVELDARCTADGVLVVHHDDTVAGADKPIVRMTRSELTAFAPWVPDLADAITACSEIWVDVEVKNDPREADWDPNDAVVRQIVAEHSEDDIVVTSFNPESVRRARRAGLRTGWLVGRGIEPIAAAREAGGAGHELLLPHHAALSGPDAAHIVSAAKEAKTGVVVWTVDDPVEMVRLAGLGVDGLVTNVPDVAVAAFAT